MVVRWLLVGQIAGELPCKNDSATPRLFELISPCLTDSELHQVESQKTNRPRKKYSTDHQRPTSLFRHVDLATRTGRGKAFADDCSWCSRCANTVHVAGKVAKSKPSRGR